MKLLFLIAVLTLLCLCTKIQPGNAAKKTPKKEILPPAFRKEGARLDKNSVQAFRDALDENNRRLFDQMRAGDFNDVAGENTRDIQRKLQELAKMPADLLARINAKNYSMMSLGDAKKIPPSVLSSLKANAQQAICSGLSEGDQDKFCFHILQKAKGKSPGNLLLNCKCDSAVERGNFDFVSELGRRQLKVLAEILREKEKNAAKWSPKVVAMMLKVSPRPSEIKKMTESALKNLFEKGFFKKNIFKDMPKVSKAVDKVKVSKAVVHAICKKFDEVFDFSTIDAAKLKKLTGIISLCNDALDKIPKKALAAAGGELAATLGKNDNGLKRKIMKNIPDAATLDFTQAKQFISLLVLDKKKLDKVSDDNIYAILSDTESRSKMASMGPTAANAAAQRIRKTDKFKDASKVSFTDLANVPSNIISRMPPSYLKQLNCAAVSGALPTIKDAEFGTQTDADAMFYRCRSEIGLSQSDLSSVDGKKIKSLGRAIKSFIKDLDKIPEKAIKEAIETFSKIEFNRLDARKVIEKLKNNGAVGNCRDYGKLRRHLTDRESSAASCGITDSKMDDETVTPDVSGMRKSQKKKLGREYIDSEGGTRSISLSNLERLVKVLAEAMSPSDAEEIGVDSECSGKMKVLCDEEDGVDENMLKKLGEKSKACGENLGHSNMDEATSGKFAKCIKYHKNPVTAIESIIPADQCKSFMLAMAASDKSKMPRAKLIKLKIKFFQCRPSASDPSVTEDHTNAAVISDDDAGDMGMFAGAMQSDDIKKLTRDALENNMQLLCSANMEFSAKETLMERIRTEISPFTDVTKIVLVLRCGAAGFFSKEDMEKIPDDILVALLPDLIDAAGDEDRARKERHGVGFKNDFTIDEHSKMDEGKDRLANKIKAAIVASKSRRRKRAISTMTCDVIKDMGLFGKSITPTEINTIPTTEFADCLEYLNTLSPWTPDRREALAKKAKDKDTFGPDTSTWTKEQVRRAGSVVVSALSETDIDKLDLSSITAAAAVGKVNYYTPSKLTRLYSRFLSSTGKKSENVTGDELGNLNHIACGAPDAQIKSMSTTAYSDAVDRIGALDSCDSDQMRAYVEHAKIAYGNDVSSWSCAIITELGNMLGGLGEDILKLTLTQLSCTSATAIALIPPTTFAKMTIPQLENLGEARAHAVTDEQQKACSEEQLSALRKNGITITVKGSAGVVSQVSTLLMVIALFFTKM